MMNDSTPAAGSMDFDFLFGHWKVRHRRLRKRLANDTQWDEFGGTSECRSILGGNGNIDDNLIALPDGPYRAATLRAFDAKSRQWSIWWLDGRTNRIDPPMIGHFKNGVGSFYCDDVFEGKPIRVRFIWSDIAEDSALWQQAFSADGGKTWETNWYMIFVREI